jgi:hypothetical protein
MLQGHLRTSPRSHRAALSQQHSVAGFATMWVLSCLHSPGLRCSCYNVVRFCCDLEARSLVMAAVIRMRYMNLRFADAGLRRVGTTTWNTSFHFIGSKQDITGIISGADNFCCTSRGWRSPALCITDMFQHKRGASVCFGHQDNERERTNHTCFVLI